MKSVHWLVAAVVLAVALGWFFRFQPLPTGTVAAVQNRWTGAIYFVGPDGNLKQATIDKQ